MNPYQSTRTVRNAMKRRRLLNNGLTAPTLYKPGWTLEIFDIDTTEQLPQSTVSSFPGKLVALARRTL